MKIPVAIIIYQRPALVRNLIKSIRNYKPEKLWIIADGPAINGGDLAKILCEKARSEAEKSVDWRCEVVKNYSEINLGLNQRIISGLNKVFEYEKSLIILEEDCQPKSEFFSFTETMLEKFKNNKNIGAISGNCYLPKEINLRSDYFFSRYIQIWGWASWRHSWRAFQKNQNENFVINVKKIFPKISKKEEIYWDGIIKKIKNKQIESWDYNLLFAFWKDNLCAVLPAQNLVKNLGFGQGATHTIDPLLNPGWQRQLKLMPPYQGPNQIQFDEKIEWNIFLNHYIRMSGKRSLFEKIKALLKKTNSRDKKNKNKFNEKYK